MMPEQEIVIEEITLDRALVIINGNWHRDRRDWVKDISGRHISYWDGAVMECLLTKFEAIAIAREYLRIMAEGAK